MTASMPDSEGETRPAQQSTEAKDALTPILEATLARGRGPMSSEEWERLRQVALRCQELGSSFQDFANELVGELLRSRMPPDATQATTLHSMSQVIGGTLCSDPYSKNRLLEFQRQLLEG